MIHLRKYQEQALEAEARHRVEHPQETRLAIVMATGLGKTIVMAEKAVRFLDSFDGAGRRVLILVHTDELASQAEAKVRLVAQGHDVDEMPGVLYRVGVVKAERDEVDADIVIASVQTLARLERRERLTDVGLVIVDECHHATASSYQVIMRHYGCLPLTNYLGPRRAVVNGEWREEFPTPALGFTATLERGDGASLGGVWQNVVFSRDISWGVRHGYLVQPVGHILEVPGGMLSGTVGRSLDVQDKVLMEALAPETIVAKWRELAKDRQTIAFMPLVRSAQSLCDAFHQTGVRAGVVHGGMSDRDRERIVSDFRAGRFEVLCNAMVLTEGFDHPPVKCVIIGRPTKSRTLGIQMAGRGLRPVPGTPVQEQDCTLIYVQDATTDLFTHADLSDKPMDRKAQGALTVMEDQWDIGQELDAQAQQAFWTGQVDAREFDPLVQRSSKVWRATEHGTPFLSISKDGEYVFVVGTSVFVREAVSTKRFRIARLHKDLPDLELALTVAEDEAQERGGDLGALLADRGRPWRKAVPSEDMVAMARYLGLDKEIAKIMASKASGKAGKLSDLISKVQATKALEPMVARIKEATR